MCQHLLLYKEKQAYERCFTWCISKNYQDTGRFYCRCLACRIRHLACAMLSIPPFLTFWILSNAVERCRRAPQAPSLSLLRIAWASYFLESRLIKPLDRQWIGALRGLVSFEKEPLLFLSKIVQVRTERLKSLFHWLKTFGFRAFFAFMSIHTPHLAMRFCCVSV